MKFNFFLIEFFGQLFPFWDLHAKNRTIRNKVKSENFIGNLSYISNAEAISKEALKEKYLEAVSIKDKLEDKAKSNLIAITISITLIFGATSLLNTVNSKYSANWVAWITFALYITAVLFLIFAGILSVRLLMHENILHTINIKSSIDENKLREDLDECTVKNINQNIIRNNYVFSSYQYIRNALICLFLILLFAISPIKPTSGGNAYSSSNNLQIVFTSEATAHITEFDNQVIIETAIAEAVNNQTIVDGKTIAFIYDIENLFIKAKCESGQIFVLYISYYQK